MDHKQRKKISKLLSLVLRHEPQAIHIELDHQGWVEVKQLLQAIQNHGRHLRFEQLQEVVRENDKQRFEFSSDLTRIRARHGHSVDIDLGYEPKPPPKLLYHGTTTRFLPSIFQNGLIKKSRNFVHLSKDEQTAFNVAKRHGKPVILQIDSEKMVQDGYLFYLSVSGIWLTEHVPKRYIHYTK